MALRLTPAILEAGYEFLRATPPFRGWRLPHADDVEFAVGARSDCFGWYERPNGQHRIGITLKFCGHTDTLLFYLAHEMVHLAQAIDGTATDGQHNADFGAKARRVCRAHGFDLKRFI